MPIPTPPLLGCLAIKGWHLVSICWTMLFVYETGAPNCPSTCQLAQVIFLHNYRNILADARQGYQVL
jgi:hypothetical protein